MCGYFPKLKTHFFVVQIFAAISVASSMQEDSANMFEELYIFKDSCFVVAYSEVFFSAK